MKSPNPLWFYALLADIMDQFTWYINESGAIRGMDELGREFCPITAIYFNKSGQYLPPDKALSAGHFFSMKLDIMNSIIDSADNVCNKNSMFSTVIRSNLLAAIAE